MAKFVKIFEDEKIKTTLTFKDREFTCTMLPWEGFKRNRSGDSLSRQVQEAFGDCADIVEIIDFVEDIEYGTDDDIEDALRCLEEYE